MIAQYLGIDLDKVGQRVDGPDGVLDCHVRATGLKTGVTITDVRIADFGLNAGVWETPANSSGNYIIHVEQSGTIADLWFSPWLPNPTARIDFQVTVKYSDGTSDVAETNPFPVTLTLPASVRSPQNPIINLRIGSWYESQIFDPCIIVDPTDATKLIMFATGMAAPVATGLVSIGRFDGASATPYTWLEHGGIGNGRVLQKGASGVWDDGGVRLGSVVYDAGTYYLFYNGNNAIGLATSTDGVTFTKYSANPILTPTGQGRNDGTAVEDAAVLKEGSVWTMVYAYRNGSIILPGFRYATSGDGRTWTKGGSGDLISASAGVYCEWHQLRKINKYYVLVFEAGNSAPPFRIFLASALAATGPYTPSDVSQQIFAPNPGQWDGYHVATPGLFLINGQWILYYSGAGDHATPYYTNKWPMGAAVLL